MSVAALHQIQKIYNVTPNHAASTKGQREDMVESQYLEGILAQNHYVFFFTITGRRRFMSHYPQHKRDFLNRSQLHNRTYRLNIIQKIVPAPPTKQVTLNRLKKGPK